MGSNCALGIKGHVLVHDEVCDDEGREKRRVPNATDLFITI